MIGQMTPLNGDGRSLHRFAELVRIFDQERRPLTARYLADAASAPRSSMAAMLRTLVDLGLLSASRRQATYSPSLRFAAALQWVSDARRPDPSLSDAMEWLRNVTQETVVLSTVEGLQMEVIRCLRSPNEIALTLAEGRRLSMTASAIGLAFLAHLPAGDLKAYLARLKRQDPRLEVAIVEREARKARRSGVAVVFGGVDEDGGAAALALPSVGTRPLILSVGGPSERIRARQADLVERLTAAAARLSPS